jgi:cyclopropane-fatty-acyl-phospholipid synthase
MDGSVVVEEGSIADVLGVILRQRRNGRPALFAGSQWFIRYLYRRFLQSNPRLRARRNVAHHYDLDGQLYFLFLDADRQYSCANFETPDQSLDDAQLAKKRHLAASFFSHRACKCSTSVAAGAASQTISPRRPARELLT